MAFEDRDIKYWKDKYEELESRHEALHQEVNRFQLQAHEEGLKAGYLEALRGAVNILNQMHDSVSLAANLGSFKKREQNG
jgi:flagellar biosynthesis/type III secretory pathway protein FliH